MNKLDDLQEEVGTWGRRTFPKSDAGTIADHLAEEMVELLGIQRVALALSRAHNKPPSSNPAEESADCLLLLLHLAHRMNFSLEDAARAKFAECQTRKWDDGDARGYSRHVEEGDRS